jgi:parallel beta-helix repeat protein
MNKVHVVLFIGCFLAVLFFSPFNLRSATWIVKSDGSGDAPTIQAAINSSAAGDTILVAAGVYSENSIFCNKDSLTLMSQSGAENTILEDSELPPVILQLADLSHFVLSGFTLRNCVYPALRLYQCHNILIEDNIFSNNVLYAITGELCSNVTINECLLYDNSSGIYMDVSSCILSNNTISHNTSCGVYLSGLYPYELYNNLIAFNDIGVATGISTSLVVSCNNVFNYSSNYLSETDPTGTDGNISIDPQYCAFDPPGSGNFYIQSDSPCLPGNHPI